MQNNVRSCLTHVVVSVIFYLLFVIFLMSFSHYVVIHVGMMKLVRDLEHRREIFDKLSDTLEDIDAAVTCRCDEAGERSGALA